MFDPKATLDAAIDQFSPLAKKTFDELVGDGLEKASEAILGNQYDFDDNFVPLMYKLADRPIPDNIQALIDAKASPAPAAE